MEVNVLFFATIKDAAGTNRIKIELLEGETVADLKSKLADLNPALEAGLPNAIFSVNQEYAEDEVVIPSGAEVAVFPPVSGGSGEDLFRIRADVLDLNTILTQMTQATTGAVCFFVGTVRGSTPNPPASNLPPETDYLEYEAYVPMAETKMREIGADIQHKWPDVERVAIFQRVGRLNPGEPAAVVACAASHRERGAFEAARYGIDRLKEIVPVWKKEVGPDGAVWIEGEAPANSVRN